ASYPRPLGPGVTVRVQRDALDAQTTAALFELSRPIARPYSLKIWKQKASRWAATEYTLNLGPETNERQAARLLSSVPDHTIFPIDAFGIQVGDIGLRATQVPAQLIKVPRFRILLPANNKLVLLPCDRAFGTKLNFRSKPFGNEW